MNIIRLLICIVALTPWTLSGQDTVFNRLDENGNKTGPWRTYYDNGKIRYSGFFENDKPVDEMRRYYPGGILHSVMLFKKDSNSAYAKLFNENGKMIAEGKYEGKLKDSIWNYYSAFDGHLVFKEAFSMGKRNGVCTKYYPDGNVSEIIEWSNDLQHGKWEQYYDNGNIRLKSSFREGKRDGYFHSFNPGGKPSVTGEYQDGEMHGIWTYFSEDGEKDFSVEYVNGKMLSNKEYEDRIEEFSRKARDISGELPEPEEIHFR